VAEKVRLCRDILRDMLNIPTTKIAEMAGLSLQPVLSQPEAVPCALGGEMNVLGQGQAGHECAALVDHSGLVRSRVFRRTMVNSAWFRIQGSGTFEPFAQVDPCGDLHRPPRANHPIKVAGQKRNVETCLGAGRISDGTRRAG